MQISEIANLPTKFGEFKIQSFKETLSNGNIKEHLAIFKGEVKEGMNLRIHSECLTGDTLGSLKCDCGQQLNFALEYIQKNGGMIIYLRQEGRNIGLFNKVNAYALQDKGCNTIEANLKLGFKADERTYEMAEFILKYYKIKSVNLLTNNPLKMQSLGGIQVLCRVPVMGATNAFNKEYLNVKKEQMGHLLD